MTDEHDDKLMQTARQLTTEISPRQDLWRNISTAIEQPAPRRMRPMLAQAAAIMLLIGASSTITYVVMKDQHTTSVVASTDKIFEQVAFTSRYTLGPDFKAARDALVAELDVELQKLPLESRATFEANLQLMHEAILATNAALEEEPDNAVLQGRLLRAYSDELDLLRRVSSLSRNVMMRNDI